MKAYALIWVGMGSNRGTCAIPCDRAGLAFDEDCNHKWEIWFDREELRKLEERIGNDGCWEVLEIEL